MKSYWLLPLLWVAWCHCRDRGPQCGCCCGTSHFAAIHRRRCRRARRICIAVGALGGQGLVHGPSIRHSTVAARLLPAPLPVTTTAAFGRLSGFVAMRRPWSAASPRGISAACSDISYKCTTGKLWDQMAASCKSSNEPDFLRLQIAENCGPRTSYYEGIG
jgi:hypothetical protein